MNYTYKCTGLTVRGRKMFYILIYIFLAEAESLNTVKYNNFLIQYTCDLFCSNVESGKKLMGSKYVLPMVC